MKEIVDSDYTALIPTAFLTAYPRTFTDIPYSGAIFEQLLQLRREENLPELGVDLIVPRLAPELEARYKLIDKLLEQTGITQVLEIAAGLSSRGLNMAANPTMQYTELDLPTMIAIKRKVTSKVAVTPDNLRFVEGNALRLKDLQTATADFDTLKPIAVINEGLLRYLNFNEKAQVATNIHALLERFGGVWITCDTTPKKFLAVQDNITKPGMNIGLSRTTGKNFDNNMFEDLDHAAKFFGGLGFSVEAHKFTDVKDSLSSPVKLKLSNEETEQLLSHGVVVVMKPK